MRTAYEEGGGVMAALRSVVSMPPKGLVVFKALEERCNGTQIAHVLAGTHASLLKLCSHDGEMQKAFPTQNMHRTSR